MGWVSIPVDRKIYSQNQVRCRNQIGFNGIEGESQDFTYKGKIEVFSWNWVVSHQIYTLGMQVVQDDLPFSAGIACYLLPKKRY